MINIGYACKTIAQPQCDLRTVTLKNATNENLLAACVNNIKACVAMIRYAAKKGLGLIRLSSDIIPLASHPEVDFPWLELCANELSDLAAIIKKNSMRVSMHPGQYTVINSPQEGVRDRAVADLIYHADFLDSLRVDYSAKIILHIGGVYDDRQSALKRFVENFKKLPDNVKRRLVLENDERLYNIAEVLEVCWEVGVPAVFDVFHHSVLPAEGLDMAGFLTETAKTWKPGDGRQKIHYSQQQPGAKIGSHSRTIGMNDFLGFYDTIKNRELDIMLEVKDKNISAVKCLNLINGFNRKSDLTEEWAVYKYAVLERSQNDYLEIRNLLKQQTISPYNFYSIIERALNRDLKAGAMINAAQHVWGYVDHVASQADKKRIFAMIESLANSNDAQTAVKKNLKRLAEKAQSEYLLHSLYLYEY